MKKILLLLFIGYSSLLASAQITFEFTYNPSQGNGSEFGSLINWNDSIYIVEVNEDDGACYDSGNLLYYNTNGIIVGGATVPGFSSTYGVLNTVRGFGNDFFSQSNSTDCGDTTIFCIAKFNLSSSLVWAKVLPFYANTVSNSRIIPTSDGGCLFSYFVYNPSKIFCTIKYDQFGDTVFTKKYSHFFSIGGIKPKQNKIYVFTTQIDSSNNSLPELVTFDLNMDSISTTYINRDSIEEGQYIVFCNDSNFACIASAKDSLGNHYSCLIKMDTLGVIIWKERLSNFKGFYSDLIERPNGNLVASYVKLKNTPFFDIDKSYILKYNSNGDSLFSKEYNNYSQTILSSVNSILGGGYVGTGSVDFFGACYMIQTDSSGNITSNYNITEDSEFEIYPNPASKEFSISSNLKFSTLNFQLVNLEGTIVLSKILNSPNLKNSISTDNLLNGFYICSLYQDGNIIARRKLVVLK